MKCKHCDSEFNKPKMIDGGFCHLNQIIVCPKCGKKLEQELIDEEKSDRKAEIERDLEDQYIKESMDYV